jgi:hypothetical protein
MVDWSIKGNVLNFKTVDERIKLMYLIVAK